MAAANRNDRFPSARSEPTPAVNRLAERVRPYFDQHPAVFQQEFLPEAIQLSAEDIRIHAWLTERLAVLHRERHGLWPRLRRFLSGHCLEAVPLPK
jgi:hypothetical protein